MDKFRYSASDRIVEAVQVPTRKEHEADKDLEQRFAKVAGWLVDQDHVMEVDFDHTHGTISYLLDFERLYDKPRWMDVGSGDWIYQADRAGVLVISDMNFSSFFKKVDE